MAGWAGTKGFLLKANETASKQRPLGIQQRTAAGHAIRSRHVFIGLAQKCQRLSEYSAKGALCRILSSETGTLSRFGEGTMVSAAVPSRERVHIVGDRRGVESEILVRR